MSPIAIRLKEVRTSQSLTQAQLAERAGVRQATISYLETKARRVDLAVLERLAKALGVPALSLLEQRPARRARGA